MINIDPLQLEEWERLANAATPGPLTVHTLEPDTMDERHEILDARDAQVCECQSEADADFFAEARMAMPILLVELRMLIMETATLREIVRDAYSCVDSPADSFGPILSERIKAVLR